MFTVGPPLRAEAEASGAAPFTMTFDEAFMPLDGTYLNNVYQSHYGVTFGANVLRTTVGLVHASGYGAPAIPSPNGGSFAYNAVPLQTFEMNIDAANKSRRVKMWCMHIDYLSVTITLSTAYSQVFYFSGDSSVWAGQDFDLAVPPFDALGMYPGWITQVQFSDPQADAQVAIDAVQVLLV